MSVGQSDLLLWLPLYVIQLQFIATGEY